ncbi:MAG: hypothetical protein RL101_71 [Actinomycetota bacterium]
MALFSDGHNLKVYLDSNAWISAINSESGIDLILSGHNAGSFMLVVSQENLNELILNFKIKREVFDKNFSAIETLIPNARDDELFVLDHSLLDYARIGDERSGGIFGLHIQGKVVNDNNLADGVHLVNAVKFEAVLISCDDAVRKTSQDIQHPLKCLKAWFSELQWDASGLEICGCKSLRE